MAIAAFKSEFRAIVTLYVVCLVVGQMVKPRLGEVPITLVDLFIAGTLPIIALRLRAPLAAYCALAAFLLPNIFFGLHYDLRGEIETTQLLMGLYACYRFLFPVLLIFCFAKRISLDDRKFCLRALVWGLGFHIVFGVFQAAVLPNFALAYGPQDINWDFQENRLVSTFLDPNLMSGLFYSAFLALLCHVSSKEAKPRRKFRVLMTGAAVAAVLTASRGGTLAFVIAFGLFLLETRDLSLLAKVKWILLAVLVITILVLIFILFFGTDFIVRTDRFGASNSSVDMRLTNLAVLAVVFMNSPIFGSGFNFLPYLTGVDFVSITGNYADGGLLYLLASVGIFGAMGVTLVAYLAARAFVHPRLFLYPAILLTVHSVSTSSMFYPLSTIFVALLAIALDTPHAHRPVHKAVPIIPRQPQPSAATK